MNRKLRLTSILLGTFRSTSPGNGSFSICRASAGLFWSPCIWPDPTSGCSLWVSATLRSRNGACLSSYDATQHAEIKVSWPEDGWSWCISAAAGGMSVKENHHRIHRSFYYQSCLAFHVVLLLIMLSSLFQMIHANANHSIMYMPNARHGAYPAMLPQGFPSAMVSQQHDGSSITHAVASAGPAEQQQVILVSLTILSLTHPQILKCFKPSTYPQTFKCLLQVSESS